MERGVNSVEEALAGAHDILAESSAKTPLSEGRCDPSLPGKEFAALHSRQGQARRGGEVSATISNSRSRFLRRERQPSFACGVQGETEGFLKLSISPPEERGLSVLSRHVLKGKSLASGQIIEAMNDGYHRLLEPSIENDVRRDVKRRGQTRRPFAFLP